jgi:hypothetical protein
VTRPRRRDSLAAEAAFREQLAAMGAVLLEPEWRGLNSRHHVRCAAGHDCWPTPAGVRRGQGVCVPCGGRDPATAEAAFRARLAELGIVLLVPYANAKTPHMARCPAGHICYPRPDTLARLRGACRTCAGNDPAAAEAAFLARLAALGAVPLYQAWQGTGRAHRVRCPAGHKCWPRPNDVQQGDGICRTCSGYDTATAEAAFRARLAKLGATPLYDCWRGTKTPHHVLCAAGHHAYPAPGDIRDGQGACATCAHDGEYDVFYVVTSRTAVKFGITSGDPRDRLGDHTRQGFTQITRLAAGLPGTVALDAERAVKQALALAGEKPLRGREYFDITCLALVLDVADSWLSQPASVSARLADLRKVSTSHRPARTRKPSALRLPASGPFGRAAACFADAPLRPCPRR